MMQNNDCNSLCLRCQLSCKQPEHMKLIVCPNFVKGYRQILIQFPKIKKGNTNANNFRSIQKKKNTD